MAQNDYVKVFLGAAIGAAVAAALVIGLGVGSMFGGKKTYVTLTNPGGGCSLGKETKVIGKVGDDLTWKITNYCGDPQTIAVGNFRTSSVASGATDCSTEGPQFPFDSGSTRSVQVPARAGGKPGKADIKLKVKDAGNLPGGPLNYYFDICMGGTRIDPELMIER